MSADVRQVSDTVHVVHGSNTNWVILKDPGGDEVTLIDTGYPGDRAALLDSLAAVGSSPEAVAAVLITHAHNDHLGSAEYLAATYHTPVYLHEAEVPHARRDFLQQVSVGQVMAQAWRPRVARWTLHVWRSGGMEQHPVTGPRPFPGGAVGDRPGEPLDLPGRPVAVHTPGHTSGHCAYHLPESGVVISGDALVSGHAISPVKGPQLLHEMFHHDLGQAVTALDTLGALAGDVLLPGHGPVHHGPVSEAAALARERAGR